MKERIKEAFKRNELSISANQAEALDEYMKLVLQENKKTNLTAITDEQDFITKHLLDSAAGADFFQNSSFVLDIGSGAGFPGIVLKILNPTLKIVLLDSVRKKIEFLNLVINRLGLQEINAVHIRIEDYAKNMRNQFDYVTSRAVANMNTLLEYSLPFLKNGGKMIVYKGPDAINELKNATNALKILGGSVLDIIQLNIEDNERSFVIVKKEKASPKKYPRGQNLPRKKPLV